MTEHAAPNVDIGNPNVARWIAEARNGSSEALGQLLESCRRYLLLVANQNLPEDVQARVGASDVVNDALLQGQQNFRLFHGSTEQELLAWLNCILANQLTNTIRNHRNSAKRSVQQEVSAAELSAQQLLPRLASENDSPGRKVQARERAERVRLALEQLPERDRQVIRWRNYEDLSFADIGARLECSTDAARQVWLRAIKKLKPLLESLDDSSRP